MYEKNCKVEKFNVKRTKKFQIVNNPIEKVDWKSLKILHFIIEFSRYIIRDVIECEQNFILAMIKHRVT